MEEIVNMTKIPRIDSIDELARFWDTHDLTEFEDELQEIAEPVFDRNEQGVMRIRLLPEQMAALKRISESKGVDQTDLIKEWVSEKLQAS
jgi:hypothetical protein